MDRTLLAFITIFIAINLSTAAPQFGITRAPIVVPAPLSVQRVYTNEAPTPYDYQYKVENPASNTYYGKSESGDATGRVSGNYYVYLPDGRLMNVDYLVDGESGFIPTVTFVRQAYPGVRA